MIQILFTLLVALLISTTTFAANNLGRITKYYQEPNGDMAIFYGNVQKTVTLRDTDPDTDEIRKEASLGHLVMERATANEKVALSDDGMTLGWLVDFGGCTAFFSCPELLVLYRSGQIVGRMEGKYIWGWRFLNGGAQVVYRRALPHNASPTLYVMYDVNAGRDVAKVVDSGNGNPLPSWAQGITE